MRREGSVLQVEALVSYVVAAELEAGPAALLQDWGALPAAALDALAGGAQAAGNAILIFMTGAEDINRTVRARRLLSPCVHGSSKVGGSLCAAQTAVLRLVPSVSVST